MVTTLRKGFLSTPRGHARLIVLRLVTIGELQPTRRKPKKTKRQNGVDRPGSRVPFMGQKALFAGVGALIFTCDERLSSASANINYCKNDHTLIQRNCPQKRGCNPRGVIGVPGGLVGGQRAYQDRFRGFKSHRVHMLARTFSCIKKMVSGKCATVG